MSDESDTGLPVPFTDAPQIVRVEANARKVKQLQNARTELLAGYPYLGALSSSDSVPYHAVRTDQFRWCGTDGISILLNDTRDGFFSEPGHVPVPDNIPSAAQTAGVAPGAPVQPNAGSNLKPMDADERAFGIGHEVLHIAREDVYWKHIFKLQGWVPVPRSVSPDGRFPFDEESFEKACDATINHALRADRVGRAPEGAFFHDKVRFDTPFGEAYATIYKEMPKPPPGQCSPPPKSGPGKGNQGAGDLLAPGQAGDPYDGSTDPNDPATQPGNVSQAAEKIAQGRAEREAMHQRAQEVARQMGQGTSAVETMITAARAPMVDWREYVHGFFSRAGGASAWNWQRAQGHPLIRVTDPYFAPTRGGHGVGHVVLAMDTSGSVGIPQTRVFLSAAAEMLEALRPRRLTIVFCDSEIQRIDDVDTSEDFREYNVPKGGGTSFLPPFEWAAKLGPDEQPDALIYLTDLEGCAPTEAPAFPVLWLNISEHRSRPVSGGRWGEVVYVPVSELQ